MDHRRDHGGQARPDADRQGAAPPARLDLCHHAQIELSNVTFGANLVGITESYAQDTNLLKMSGFTVVNGFVQLRQTDRVQLMVNASNLFNKAGFFEFSQGTVPANGIGWGRSINGRTVSASLRYGL